MSLINCEINISLMWSSSCVITSSTERFSINDT